ncbi:MAG: TetR/AcrR family transcriptional regulator [Ilumatobacteraceae bacterium]
MSDPGRCANLGRTVEPSRRQDYFDTAIGLLANGGVATLTIAALCDGLEVTKGSFYHHFASMDGFARELLQYWEADGSARLVAALEGVDDPVERISVLKELGITTNHDAESAIRAWGRSYEPAAECQRRVDDGRQVLLRRAYLDVGIDEHRATVLAHVGVSILVGNQQMGHPVDADAVARDFDEYERWILSLVRRAEPTP